MMRRTWILAVAVGLAIAAGPTVATALAADDQPMDHAAMAASYQSEAKDAQQKAALHQTMLNRYKNAPTPPKGAPLPKEAMVQHCQKLVDAYSQAAKQAENLAKMHQDAASHADH